MSKKSSAKSPQIFSKINILDIIGNHLGTLKNHGSPKYSIGDILLFFILPFFCSTIVVYFKIILNKDLIGVLVNVFSIFGGLLLNLLVLIYDLISKSGNMSNSQANKNMGNSQANKLKVQILEQVYFNISFEILLAVFIIVLLSISSLSEHRLVSSVLSVVVFSLASLFTLTLLMVLKRVNKLISHEIDQQKDST